MRSTSRDLEGREGKEAQEQGRLCTRRPGKRHPRVLATALALPPPGPLPSVRAGALLQALHLPAPPPLRQPGCSAGMLFTSYLLQRIPEPQNPRGWGGGGTVTSVVLPWTCREEESWVLCGKGHKGNIWGLLSRQLYPLSSW